MDMIGAKPHRDRRELPEIRHQIRMRIGRQSAALGEFLAEIVQVLFVQAGLPETPRINARRSVSLEINHVPAKSPCRARKKWLNATSYNVAEEA